MLDRITIAGIIGFGLVRGLLPAAGDSHALHAESMQETPACRRVPRAKSWHSMALAIMRRSGNNIEYYY
jgi:hypothetical protein